MTDADWRARAATTFACDKRPASGTRGMVVTNHPLASAAGAAMLAEGGNAIDAAVAALFALTVVEPMMVGICGGGMAHLRLADGRHVVIDGLSTAPAASHAASFRPISDRLPDYQETAGRENAIGPKAVAVPGALKGWCEALARFGTLPLADVMAPAIRHAARGFIVTPYLAECIQEVAGDLAGDAAIAARYLKDGTPLAAGARLVMGDYAETLRIIATEGPDALHDGSLGRIVADHIAGAGGFLARADLAAYRTVEREPVRGSYRGYEILGPPPPSSGGVHVIQMLNILEGHDIAALGFGSPEALHLVAESLKIAFADRAVGTADPAFIDVPVAALIDKAYAADLRARIDMRHAVVWTPGIAPLRPAESPNTTHVTIADGDGNIVASTQTINSLFGASLRPASQPRPVDRPRQTHHHLDVAADGAAGRQARFRARPARRFAHFRLGDAGAGQPHRSRHEPAGGGRGAAPVDARRRRRDRGGFPRERARGVARARPRNRRDAACRRRHECDRIRRGRRADRRRLLARRRHADRHRRRPRARQCAVLAGSGGTGRVMRFLAASQNSPSRGGGAYRSVHRERKAVRWKR